MTVLRQKWGNVSNKQDQIQDDKNTGSNNNFHPANFPTFNFELGIFNFPCLCCLFPLDTNRLIRRKWTNKLVGHYQICYNSSMTTQKLYCFVDETGQDTKGDFFLVAVVLKEAEDLQLLQDKLEEIEETSKKNLKWSRSSFKVREIYLKQLMTLKQ